MLKQKLLSPILQAIFPLLVAEPPPGEQDPEDEDDNEDYTENDNPKHCAAQVDFNLKQMQLLYYFPAALRVLSEP